MTRRLTLLLTLSLILARGQTARAEPIAITAGYMFVGPSIDDSFMWAAGNGFSFTVLDTFPPTQRCSITAPCAPGDLVNLSETDRAWDDVFGVIDIDGRSEDFISANLLFDITAGDVILDEEFSYSPTEATYSFLGRLKGTTLSGVPFDREVMGRGSADALLSLDRFEYGHLNVEYRFASAEPVPEPATFLLLGSGLLGIVLRRRQRAARAAAHVGATHEV
jgi:hypothetical protein